MPGVAARLAGIGLLVVLTTAAILYGTSSEGSAPTVLPAPAALPTN